ncbi:MAG: hypothetical protein U9N46_10500 [Euryarchaeota archaeon]|nr:MAG: hypothetical protein C5S47_02565 [ANME-2 cluster archaeon]MEA1865596.1 hypothetical protein [Euryarchaeota archaeon]
MVSWMYNNAKDVKTEIDNTLRVSLAFAPFVKLENKYVFSRGEKPRDFTRLTQKSCENP